MLFLTMELLDGVPLSVRIRRQQRMTTQEALPNAEQMAGALGAARAP